MSTENPYAAPATFTPPVAPEEPRDYPLASRWARFAGSIIDTLIMIPLLMIILGGIYFFTSAPLTEQTELIDFIVGVDEALGDGIYAELAATAIYLGVFVMVNGYALAKRGQTIGKIVMRTRIVDRRGQIPNFLPLFLKRYVSMALFGLIPGIGQLVNWVNALAIFRSNRQCMHDDLAGTRVVQL